MTDRPDENETDQTGLTQEEGFITEDELQAEAWQDELPPEDDFHDMEEIQEELSDEEPEEEAVYESDGGSKRRGKNILFGVLAVAALAIGGMAYLQFGGSSEGGGMPVPMASVMDSKDLAGSSRVDGRHNQAEEALTPTTGETDITALYKAAQQQTAGGAMALPSGEVMKQDGDKTALGTSTEIMTMTDESPAAPAPQGAAPTVAKVENIPMPQLQPQAAAPPIASASGKDALAALPVALGSESKANETLAKLEDKVKGMDGQMDALKKELDQALQKNVELVKRLESMQSASAGQEETAALQIRLKQLEQQLDAAKAEAAAAKKKAEAPVEITLQADSSGVSEDVAFTEVVPEKVVKKAPEKKRVKKKTVRKKKVVAKKKAKTKAKPKAPAWVLRAITPDAAWVSIGSHAADLRRVAVGETLDGLGKIKQIRQNGDVWELVGTTGTLR